jgi:copper chaperone CopZ
MRGAVGIKVFLGAGILVLAMAVSWLARELAGGRRESLRARHVTLEVAGMTCAHCAGLIRDEIASIPGVDTVEVRFEDRRAHVVCDPTVVDSSLTAAVHRAGRGYRAAVATP